MRILNKVVEVEWTEYERGWGQRTDGYSYHWSMEEAKRYIDDYCKGLPPNAPEVYYASSEPRYVSVDPVFALLVKGKRIIWTDKSSRIEE